MKLEIAFLRSRVARRIFFLFVCCTLLPIAILAVVSFYQVSQESTEQRQQELRQTSKSKGMDILERLGTVSTELQIVAIQLRRGESAPAAGLADHFAGISLYREGKLAAVLFGTPSRLPVLEERNEEHLRSNKALLVSGACGDESGTCLEMLRMVDPQDAQLGILVGEIKPAYVWDAEGTPPGYQISIFGTKNRQIMFGNPASVPPPTQGGSRVATAPSRDFPWSNAGEKYDAAYWDLFLTPNYQIAPWTVVASRPHDDLLDIVHNFRRSFPLIVALTLWVAILASLVQIRRTLVPLERLREGTMQIAAQRFDSRVEVKSGDEFQELATSFNSMAVQLGKQFHALKTIGEIDQAILGSLNRDGILNAVLDRVPEVYAGHCVAVGLIDDSRLAGSSLSVRSRGNEKDTRLMATVFSQADLRRMQSRPQSFQTREEDIPDFLRPLSGDELSAFSVFPIFVEHRPFGALVYGHSSGTQLEQPDAQYARQVADQLAVAFSNVGLVDALKRLHRGTLTALARAIDANSGWTAGHSERVTRLAVRIGNALGLGSNDLRILEYGGLLHDIGKIGTPRSILDKPGQLNPEETRTMREHVNVGVRILEPIPSLSEALPVVAQHHERFDGSGYPKGLKGEEISLFARIFAVADTYDAMTSDRPYRPGLPAGKARDLIAEQSGGQFDPRVVEKFMEMLDHGGPAAQDPEEKAMEEVAQS